MDLRMAIADLLEREGISQKVLAERAGIHQATVSRALRRQPQRKTVAYAKLCKYMQEDATTTISFSNPVMDALRDTWDGSDEHAAALARLIVASSELWPTLGKGTPS
jgi:transcriptional regulator with XRE-family HTH domain